MERFMHYHEAVDLVNSRNPLLNGAEIDNDWGLSIPDIYLICGNIWRHPDVLDIFLQLWGNNGYGFSVADGPKVWLFSQVPSLFPQELRARNPKLSSSQKYEIFQIWNNRERGEFEFVLGRYHFRRDIPVFGDTAWRGTSILSLRHGELQLEAEEGRYWLWYHLWWNEYKKYGSQDEHVDAYKVVDYRDMIVIDNEGGRWDLMNYGARLTD